MRAYQNNPQLNAQRASSAVRPTKTCRRPCRVIARRSRSPPVPAINTDTNHDLRRYADPLSSALKFTAPTRRAAVGWTHSYADAVQRQSNRQQDPRGREPGFRRARSVASAEQTVLLNRRDDLHGLSARLRDRRGSTQQRPRARADAQADPGPLQRRRSDTHRRRAVGGPAGRGPDSGTVRRIHADDDPLELSPHHRQRTGRHWRRARRSIATCRERCHPRSASA